MASNANDSFALDASTGVLTLIDANLSAGGHEVTVRVNDGRGAQAAATVALQLVRQADENRYFLSMVLNGQAGK